MARPPTGAPSGPAPEQPADVAAMAARLRQAEQEAVAARAEADRLGRLLAEGGVPPWTGDQPTAERFLALTDRIIGLEAELAQARYRADMEALAREAAVEREAAALSREAAALAREAQVAARVEAMLGSATWRAGTLVGRPLRAARRAWSR